MERKKKTEREKEQGYCVQDAVREKDAGDKEEGKDPNMHTTKSSDMYNATAKSNLSGVLQVTFCILYKKQLVAETRDPFARVFRPSIAIEHF